MLNSNINRELLEEVRLHYSSLILFGNQFEIVPEELTHDYLFRNFEISSDIEEYYYLPCLDLITNEDYEKFVASGYIGDQKTTLKPYPFIYKGAFIPRKQLYYRLQHLIYRSENYKGKSIKKFVDLFPYLDDYSIGFREGFNKFEDDCVKKFLSLFADKSDFINKTFEYVTKEILFTHSWKNNHFGFVISMISNNEFKRPGEIINAFEDGKFQGYFYKAWSIILSNNILFKDLFKNLSDSNQIDKYEDTLIYDLMEASYSMQQNKIFWNVDEDTRTRQLLDLLPKKYNTKDQSKYGKSLIGKKAGSVDGVIKNGKIESFLEAFNLKSLDKKSH